MPVLPPEPAVFPEGLVDEPDVPIPQGRRWHVMYTRPRQEKSLARELYRSQIPFYLPLIRQRHRHRRRVITSHNPLFAGYVPVYVDQPEWNATLATGRVVRPLKVADQVAFWGDLRQVHRLISSGAAITPEDRLVPGMRVVVRSGPLAGLEGVIQRTASGRRFVVEVDFLQRGASVLLDDVDLAFAG